VAAQQGMEGEGGANWGSARVLRYGACTVPHQGRQEKLELASCARELALQELLKCGLSVKQCRPFSTEYSSLCVQDGHAANRQAGSAASVIEQCTCQQQVQWQRRCQCMGQRQCEYRHWHCPLPKLAPVPVLVPVAVACCAPDDPGEVRATLAPCSGRKCAELGLVQSGAGLQAPLRGHLSPPLPLPSRPSASPFSSPAADKASPSASRTHCRWSTRQRPSLQCLQALQQ